MAETENKNMENVENTEETKNSKSDLAFFKVAAFCAGSMAVLGLASTIVSAISGTKKHNTELEIIKYAIDTEADTTKYQTDKKYEAEKSVTTDIANIVHDITSKQ